MSEPDISTLARRLAEQNNVDWRVLRGSGPDGKVVERDVLDFLAKVMAGEEAVNPTPEPVPDGMEAWPDQDIQGFRAGLGEAATLGELRDELGNASREYVDGATDEPAAADGFVAAAADLGSSTGGAAGYSGTAADLGGAHTTTNGEQGIDEDIFLFDDDDSGGVDEPAGVTGFGATTVDPASDGFASAAAGGDGPAAADDLDDLLVAGDDFDAAGPGSDVDTHATSSHDSRFGGVPTGYLGADDEDALSGEFGDANDLGEATTPFDSDSRYTADLGEESQVAASTSGGWGDDIDFGGDSSSTHDQGSVPDLWGPEATAQPSDSDLWTGPTGSAIDSYTSAPQDAHDDDVTSQGFTEPAGAFAFEAEQEAMPAEALAVADSVVADDDRELDRGMDNGLDDGIGAGLAAVGATLLSGGSATLPLARPGTILRRNIDVSALAAAQLAVGQELGFDEPLGASAFLLRAVVKAAASTGYSAGAVGLAVLEEGVTIKRVDGAAEMPFTELIRLVGSVDIEEDEPVLVAADLSALDVDEAVLELSTPVVSLGRILYDNQRGAYRSTLSLTGPMPLDTAAGLLARVAELLDAPVRLVL